MFLLLAATGCSEPKDDARDEPSVADVVDPNDVMADCLHEQELDVRRGGEVDGRSNAGST